MSNCKSLTIWGAFLNGITEENMVDFVCSKNVAKLESLKMYMKIEYNTIDAMAEGLRVAKFQNLQTLMLWAHEGFGDEKITLEHMKLLV